jgi:hypothetical protein
MLQASSINPREVVLSHDSQMAGLGRLTATLTATRLTRGWTCAALY